MGFSRDLSAFMPIYDRIHIMLRMKAQNHATQPARAILGSKTHTLAKIF